MMTPLDFILAYYEGWSFEVETLIRAISGKKTRFFSTVHISNLIWPYSLKEVTPKYHHAPPVPHDPSPSSPSDPQASHQRPVQSTTWPFLHARAKPPSSAASCRSVPLRLDAPVPLAVHLHSCTMHLLHPRVPLPQRGEAASIDSRSACLDQRHTHAGVKPECVGMLYAYDEVWFRKLWEQRSWLLNTTALWAWPRCLRFYLIVYSIPWYYPLRLGKRKRRNLPKEKLI